MRKPNREIQLTSYEELIGGAASQVTEIALKDLFTFKGHPFHVIDDEKMEELAESVRTYGVLTPGIVRARIEGGYEIISGHRRKRACELAELTTMPVFIKDYTDDEAAIILVDTNIQREDILPSEKAKAYNMKYQAMKHQGSKDGGLSLDTLGEASGESGKTVQRYIWLSRLSDKLLEMVDKKTLPFMSGIEISFLSPEQQGWIQEIIEQTGLTVSKPQAAKIRGQGQTGELTPEKLKQLLSEKRAQPRKITITSNKLDRYFNANVSNEEIERIIFMLLDEWGKTNPGNLTSGHSVQK